MLPKATLTPSRVRPASKPSLRSPRSFPSIWLMTDERQGEGLWASLPRLPKGAGIIFRHHATCEPERSVLFVRLRAQARRRGLMLLVAGIDTRLRADGTHHRRSGPPRFGTASAHDIKELRAAERSGAAAILISPIFPTRSHPGKAPLGLMRLARLCRATAKPVIALGGMTKHRARQTARIGAYGWAAIDAWGSDKS
ncbi:thiamine-phosphate pyrophosphorylase [Sphingomonas sp. YR710]|nr:thiamine-phosphate pyrophosphorylase [Sphingomonas sp. YR710]